jgi:serine/threonine-protein kinase
MNIEGRNAMIGKQIANYRITEKLGEGGMGVVYKGIDTNLARPVAVKMLTAELAHNPEIVERFRAEARAQANLNHVNLATLYAFLVDEGTAFMVMEFVEGQTFEQMIRARGPIPPDTALPLFKQALLGIGAAHRMGIVHRDIKPSNIMLNSQGTVKVMDFGIAKVVGTRGMTRTGMQLGTPAYMAPEQIQNKAIDMRTDIYALGITLYQMLSGQLPFQSDSDFETMNSQVAAVPPPLAQMFPYAPVQYQNVVMKAMEKDPNNRFQTVEEFGAALENPESVPAPGVAAAVAPEVKRTVMEMGGATRVEAAATSAAMRPATVSGPGAAAVAPRRIAAEMPAPVVTKKGGWNLGYTFATIAVAAVAIILAVVMYGRKTSVVAVSQVNSPAPISQSSPLGAPQTSAPAASIPDDLMKTSTLPAPSGGSPLPAGSSTASQPEKPLSAAGKAGAAVPSATAKATNANRSKAVAQPAAKQTGASGGSTVGQSQDAPPTMSGMSASEVEELEHRIDQLSSRAAAIDNSLNRMQKQQAAAGYGLRGDMLAAQASMQTNLQKAQSSMEHGDPVKAKKYADAAAANAETLEQFLGR